ncbi:phospholipase A1-like [Scaptodrosophila lebanonensis]|uniref:Phospholipase A1-like n=1 Tax=Drosophila lebanonensis TaxID=7225 RepID=A0A6J2T5F7_DROLE|nr:phospholipase A1-like [Scaptodrosophila lebanonensis]
MKWGIILAICALTNASALHHKDRVDRRVNGENGWFVPQVDGNFQWLDLDEANEALARYETIEEGQKSNRISLNAVTFYLYTQRNPDDGQLITANEASINASNFRAENPTRFTIHGWNSNYKDGVNVGIRRAWFGYGDYNMIAVDWARGRSLDYASSVSGAPAAGKKISELIDFLVQHYDMSLESLEVVGFSLGAHVAGFTAKNVATGQVQKVVGLDPAMPLINYNKTEKRLCSTDAFYVESIQTNGGTLGFTQPIGKAAFYPNGGRTQPGCIADLTGGCSHTRAVLYYVESLESDNFPTMKCNSYQEANNNDCGSTYSSVRMGSKVNSFVASGEFYVPVNEASPYGIGKNSNGSGEDEDEENATTTEASITEEDDTTSIP